MAFIRKSYLDGQPVLFPYVDKDSVVIITDNQKIVSNFNDDIAVEMGLSEKTDLELLRQNASKEANRLIVYIVKKY